MMDIKIKKLRAEQDRWMSKAEKNLAKADRFKARIEKLQARCAHAPPKDGVCPKCGKEIEPPVAEAKSDGKPVEPTVESSPPSPPSMTSEPRP
jgi:hypothetical protein